VRGVLAIVLGRIDVVKALLRSFTKDDPRVVRYSGFFDPGILIQFLRSNYPVNERLSLADLRAKTIILLRMVLDARSADLTKIDLNLSSFPDESFAEVHLAHLKNGMSITERIPAYQEDPSVCPVRALAAYLRATWSSRTSAIATPMPRTVPNSMSATLPPTFGSDSLSDSSSEELEEDDGDSDDEDVSHVYDVVYDDDLSLSALERECDSWGELDANGDDDDEWSPPGAPTRRRTSVQPRTAGVANGPLRPPEGGGGDRATAARQAAGSPMQEPLSPLFLQLKRPYRPLSAESLARIAIGVMKKAGIDTSIFKAHAIRGAVATKMLDMGELLSDVMRLGRWRSFTAFNEYYNRQTVRVNVMDNLMANLLPAPQS